jgi:hypothetical protein
MLPSILAACFIVFVGGALAAHRKYHAGERGFGYALVVMFMGVVGVIAALVILMLSSAD